MVAASLRSRNCVTMPRAASALIRFLTALLMAADPVDWYLWVNWSTLVRMILSAAGRDMGSSQASECRQCCKCEQRLFGVTLGQSALKMPNRGHYRGLAATMNERMI